MIISKNTPLSILDTIDTSEIYISKDISLNSKILELLLRKYPNSKIIIKTFDENTSATTQNNVLYNNDELKILADNVNMARSKYGKDIVFDDNYTIEQAITASTKLNEWENLINNATINGEPLSPLEKYAMAYALVSNRVYHEENTNFDPSSLSRNLISVMSNDFIVCAGFANILSTLCTRIGIPCTVRDCAVWKQKSHKWGNHANCIVRIEDEKYNVHGLFNADPTWDCISKEIEELNLNFNFDFRHFLLADSEYRQLFPQIKLDKLASDSDLTKEKVSMISTKISNIHSLFPELPIADTFNNTMFDNENNEINYDRLKSQTLKRIKEAIDKLPENNHKEQINPEYVFNMAHGIAYFIVNEVLTKDENTPTEAPRYINNFLSELNSAYNHNELINLFTKVISEFEQENILDSYIHAMQSTEPENYYYFYQQEYEKLRLAAKPLTKEIM